MFSRPSSSICHHVHLERFAVPGRTPPACDTHTLREAVSACLLLVPVVWIVAMVWRASLFLLYMPKIIRVYPNGRAFSFCICKGRNLLEVLRRISVKGGVEKPLEYCGPGVKSLSVSERATMTNMGAETGATTSIFQSDEVTREWLRAQGRERDWVPLYPDEDAIYDEEINLDLSSLEPMVRKTLFAR